MLMKDFIVDPSVISIFDSVANVYNFSSFYDMCNDPTIIDGALYSPGVHLRENAFRSNSIHPIIALGIEVDIYAGTSIVDPREDYAEDYIPAYFYSDEADLACHEFGLVGYDDVYDNYNNYPLQSQIDNALETILFVVPAPVDESGNVADRPSVNGTYSSYNVTTSSQATCEIGDIRALSGYFSDRFQKHGKSRIRGKYGWGYGNTITNSDHLYDIMDVNKNDFPISLSSLGNFGYQYATYNVTTQSYNSNALFSGLFVVYEYDYYAWPQQIAQQNFSAQGYVQLGSLRYARAGEFYSHGSILPNNWCLNSSANCHYQGKPSYVFVQNLP
jgi:hypothetical protein